MREQLCRYGSKQRAHGPGGDGATDWGGDRSLRVAFANADAAGIAEMGRRLAAFVP